MSGEDATTEGGRPASAGRRPSGFSNLVLHLHPRAVPAESLRLSRTFGLGGAALVLFLLLAATGALLLVSYEPSPERAYGTVTALVDEVRFGALVRNAHHWAANGLVLVAFLHLLRVFYRGGHLPPRRGNWLVGVVLLLLAVASAFTGYVLPWDQLAYGAITISTGMLVEGEGERGRALRLLSHPGAALHGGPLPARPLDARGATRSHRRALSPERLQRRRVPRRQAGGAGPVEVRRLVRQEAEAALRDDPRGPPEVGARPGGGPRPALAGPAPAHGGKGDGTGRHRVRQAARNVGGYVEHANQRPAGARCSSSTSTSASPETPTRRSATTSASSAPRSP